MSNQYIYEILPKYRANTPQKIMQLFFCLYVEYDLSYTLLK